MKPLAAAPKVPTTVRKSRIPSHTSTDAFLEPDQVVVVIEGEEYPVDIEYRPDLQRGTQSVRHALTPQSTRDLRPECFGMMRELDNLHEKSNKPGLSWFQSTRQLIAHESRLEALALLMLDFEGETTAIASQPFTLHFHRSRKPVRHTPDYFQRLADGTGVVVDVKPTKQLLTPNVTAQFDASRQACEAAGWCHRVIETPNEHFASTMWMLAGYRFEHDAYEDIDPGLREVLANGPLPWAVLTERLTAATGIHHGLVVGALLHAAWRRTIDFDMAQELNLRTVTSLTGQAR